MFLQASTAASVAPAAGEDGVVYSPMAKGTSALAPPVGSPYRLKQDGSAGSSRLEILERRPMDRTDDLCDLGAESRAAGAASAAAECCVAWTGTSSPIPKRHTAGSGRAGQAIRHSRHSSISGDIILIQQERFGSASSSSAAPASK